ncbi:oxygen-insensitive NADPH nitroreductase [Halalkalibacter urbisdiaboli]|uniref:oxygen-insensitive NADPH nitroreductase n=1 Tax=Halalkalibacter urbisdiaboli TaxID=1960589 RepID=UPI000B447674|nr:oxygen-insensitive NADPH nitroreductase [Halalkalibacter urbisdiaboli]
MNETIRTIKQHRSYRAYQNKPVSHNELDAIIESAQWAPSWIHGQQVTIISVKEEDKKAKLTELVGNQAHVAQAPVFLVFCADFYRASLAGETQGKQLQALEDIDALLVGATDVGLAMANAITAAESFGLGTVPIGGIRRNPLEVIELLNLPKYVIPIAGLCLGYPEHDPGQKPRMPKELIHHQESYQQNVGALLTEYDQTMTTYTKEKTGQAASWSERISSFYEKPYYNSIADMVKRQGFTCKNLK